MKKIAIIGAGASGLMAACFASKNAQVILFEKQKIAGRKILATGNGRCNISNRNIDASYYFGKNQHFVKNIFEKFGLTQTEEFFSSIGIPFVEGKDGKLFPASLQASAVQKTLIYEAQKRGAEILLHRRIDKIEPLKNGFMLITAGKEHHFFDAVICAAGSCAYPQLGGSNSGYELAQLLGHTLVPPIPAIVPLNTTPKILHRLQGIKWDCALTAKTDDKIIAVSQGEVLFTKYGISGPASLEISTLVNREITMGKKVEIIADFFPKTDCNDLALHLLPLFRDLHKPLFLCLVGTIKERIAEVVLSIMGKDPFAPAKTFTKDDVFYLANLLKNLTMHAGNPRSFSDAMVALGGIDTDEIDPNTMQSKLIPQLFFAGELLDITGTTGGYNLQFAWSSGAIAGMSAAEC